MTKPRPVLVALLLLIAAVTTKAAPQMAACENLSTLALPNATVTLAESTPTGAFTAPSPFGNPRPIANLPAFCRVAITSKPTPDSDIRIEVWLPADGWNGKYLAVGNAGWGGALQYLALADALRRGYAASSTDDGHGGGDNGSFALGHPEKFIDFAYRSQHEMALKSKAVIHAFYGRAPRYSYWNGCSAGGREGLLQAHDYPDEFDGIIAGDPATFRRNAWALWIANAALKDTAHSIPPSKYPFIHQAVLDTCDTLDGLKDGLIADPTVCHFDPQVLLCKSDMGDVKNAQGADSSSCLTAPQVETARTILSAPRSRDGREIFPRLEPGTELRWARLSGGPEPAALFADYFKFIVYKDVNWDWRSFDLDRDSRLADEDAKGIISLDPDLSKFAAHGGKLLMYHGWADQQVAPRASIEFYDALSSAARDKASWARLFMAAGMAHCFGGEGPDTFDKVAALEDWVEKGKAPDKIVASHSTAGKVDRTRPLCPYPQRAAYTGSGSIDEASNFICKAPPRKRN